MAQPTPKRAPEEIPHEVEQETIHVPRGKSRARYIATIALLIFTLVIFVVSDLVQGVMSGGGAGANDTYLSWRHPTAGLQEWSATELTLEKRKYDSLLRLLQLDREAADDFVDDRNFARLLVLDRLARDAGLDVGDGDLRNALTQGGFIVIGREPGEDADVTQAQPEFFFQVPAIGGDTAGYVNILRNFDLAPAEFEERLRTLMRIERFENLMLLPSQPDPADIEKAWRERHGELRFEFVAIDVASVRPQVDAETPDEATLRSWYDGLDPGRKRGAFAAEWRPERASAELLAWVFDAGADPQALLAKHPRPEGTDLEQLARDYHTQFKNARFRRPEEKTDAATADERLYFTFDEVADQARTESQVHAALVELSLAVQERVKAGETIDLASEGAALGLAHVAEKEPLSAADWASHATAGDPMLGGAILRAVRGDRFVPLTVGSKAIVFGRADQRIEAGPPPFDDIAPRVAEEWKKERTLEVAKEKAQAFHDALKPPGPLPPDEAGATDVVSATSEAFASAAQAQGLELQSTDWLDRADLRFEVLDSPSELERFRNELVRSLGSVLGHQEGQVGPPTASADRERVYVVRHAGEREPPEVAIEPGEYDQLTGGLSLETLRADRERLFGFDALASRYQLTLPSREPPPQDVPAGQ